MTRFLKHIKAGLFALPRLATAALVLVCGNSFATSESLDRYHGALTEKYGYEAFEVTVTPVTNPERLKTIRQMSEKTRHRLVDFASSIEANEFTYKSNNDFWRLNKGKRVFSYTFSIDILKNNVKQFDYFCFAIIDSSKDRGITMDCSAFRYTDFDLARIRQYNLH